MQKIILVLAFVIIKAGLSQAQGTFQNLDFESAQVVFNNPPNDATIATTNALPGWTAFAPYLEPGGITRTQQLSSIHYGPFGTSPTNFPPVALMPAYGGLSTRVSIDGSYDVLLSSGFISQTGLVPADAQTLLFKVHSWNYPGASVLASLDGQGLSAAPLLTVPNTSQSIGYTLYGADISSFAGHSADLNFSGTGGGEAALLDDIEFSSEPIPEPSAISLICFGSGILFYASKRKRVWL